MKREKFIVLGLPRSGTTLLSNIIHSHENGFCFIEPHFHYVRHQSTDFLNDPKLSRVASLKYVADSDTPLDDAIRRIQEVFPFAGFKETFRSREHERYSTILPNDDIMSRYVFRDYRLLPIMRNPLYVWNSFKSFHPAPGTWSADLQLFLNNYDTFIDFIGDARLIIYEELCANPRAALAGHVGMPVDQKIQLVRRKLKMGDKKANASTEVTSSSRGLSLDTSEMEEIIDSTAMASYRQLAKECW